MQNIKSSGEILGEVMLTFHGLSRTNDSSTLAKLHITFYLQ